MGFVGMDTAQGVEHAGRLRTAGELLEERHSLLHQLIRTSEATWRDPDADGFRAHWSAGASRLRLELSAALEDAGVRLEEEAQQRRVPEAPGVERICWSPDEATPYTRSESEGISAWDGESWRQFRAAVAPAAGRRSCHPTSVGGGGGGPVHRRPPTAGAAVM